MTEQERQEDTPEQEVAGAGEGAAEAEQPVATTPSGGKKSGRAEGTAKPAGPAIAVVPLRRPPGRPSFSRRRILQIGFWAGLGAAIAGSIGSTLGLLWPQSVKGFGGQVSAGDVSQYPPGTKTAVPEGRFWLVNLTQEQGGPGLLALWWKCPHLGCTVPWRETFVWPDPTSGAPKQGWFRCPCHGSTFTDAGILVFGPSSRPMDTMALTVENGRITVDTGNITPGGPDNADRAVRA